MTEMTKEELLRRLGERFAQDMPPEQAIPTSNGPIGPTERLRTMAQGLTFGGADEAEAWIRSQLNDEGYDEALADVRGRLEKYRESNPGSALFDEIGGAALPAIAAAFVSGGASVGGATSRLLPNLAKMVGLGAVEGGTYAFLTGEDGIENRVKRVPGGLAVGAVGGPLGYGAARGTSKAFTGFLDHVNRRFGPRVGKAAEREMRRIMADADISPEEAMQRIESGDLLAELNPTLRTAARGFYAKDRGAARLLSDVYEERPGQMREQIMEYLQSTMGAEGNALKAFNMSDDAARATKGADYNRIFAQAGNVDDETTSLLVDAFRRVPSATKELDSLYRAKTGRNPFFKVTDEGIEFTRNPTLEEAEIMRRALSTAKGKAYREGAGPLGGEIGSIERNVRNQLDDFSEELKKTRTGWSEIETARDAFDAGRKALARSPDEAAIEFEEVTRKGRQAVEAYRAGVVDAYRRKAATGANASLPRLLASEERKEGAILRTVFPQDQLEEMVARAERGARSQEASSRILHGSETAITQGRMQQVSPGLLQDGLEAVTGSPIAAIRLATDALKSLKRGLSPEDMQAVAKMMVESNPQAFQRALEGGSSDVVLRIADDVLKRASTATGLSTRRGAVPAGLSLLDSLETR